MNNTTKKVLKIVSSVLLYFFLALCIFSVVITIFAKKDIDGAAEIFGYQLRTVTTNSMGKSDQTDVSDFDIGSIPKNSLVFIKLVPDGKEKAKEWYGDVEPGDVLTFRYVYTSQVTITHRVISSDPNENGGYTIVLEGDNKSAEDSQGKQVIHTEDENSYNYVIGKVVAKSFIFGLLLTFLKMPLGMVLVVILPCLIIIILEVIRIVGLVNADKKKKADEENAKKDSELEELKRKLAELERKAADADNSSGGNGDEEL